MGSTGQRMMVVDILAGHRATHRLAHLGLKPGVVLEIVQGQGDHALILAVGDTRIAVERGIAHKVLVQPVFQEQMFQEQKEHEEPRQEQPRRDIRNPKEASL